MRATRRPTGSALPTWCSAALLLAACLLAACKERESPTQSMERKLRTHAACRQPAGEDVIYTTAAGFRFAVPAWTDVSAFETTYNARCEVESMILDFAWIDGRLLPIPHEPKDRSRAGIAWPERYDTLRLALSFRPPAMDAAPYRPYTCAAKTPVHHYPELGLRMCPQWAQAKPEAPVLAFWPRFEIVDDSEYVTSFSCGDRDFVGHPVAQLPDVEVAYSCRGYWRWRPGAHAMFDFGPGKVLRKSASVMRAARATLDGWIVTAPAPAQDRSHGG